MTESRSPLRRVRAGLAWPIAAATLVVALPACGSNGRASADGTLHVALREYRITPEKVHAGAGAVTFDIDNAGRLTHSLLIETAAGTHVATSDPVAPGQTATLTASLARGHYLMTSGVQSDKALGLYGTLDVG